MTSLFLPPPLSVLSLSFSPGLLSPPPPQPSSQPPPPLPSPPPFRSLPPLPLLLSRRRARPRASAEGRAAGGWGGGAARFLYFFYFLRRVSPPVLDLAEMIRPFTADSDPTGTQTGSDKVLEPTLMTYVGVVMVREFFSKDKHVCLLFYFCAPLFLKTIS